MPRLNITCTHQEVASAAYDQGDWAINQASNQSIVFYVFFFLIFISQAVYHGPYNLHCAALHLKVSLMPQGLPTSGHYTFFTGTLQTYLHSWFLVLNTYQT